MKKTREIDVFVNPATLKHETIRVVSLDALIIQNEWIKAKLIIEEPERTVTISESDFDAAFREWCPEYDGLVSLKRKLFSKDSK